VASANELLRDALILQAVLLQHLQRGHLNRLDALFTTQARQVIRGAFGVGDLAGQTFPAGTGAQVIAEIMGRYGALIGQAKLDMITAAQEAAAAEVAWWNAGAGLPDELVALLPWESVDTSILAGIGELETLGLTPAEWATKTAGDFMRQGNLQLQQAAGLGETMAAAAARIVSLNEKLGRVGAERMARTVFSGATGRVGNEWKRRNADMVSGWVWLATLDDRTCQVCGARDGTRWKTTAGPDIPAHARCRCVREPILKSWRQLGVDIDEIPPDWRSSMDGIKADPINYDGWLRGTSKANQISALGKARWDVWNSMGRPPMRRFVDGDRILSLEDLIGGG